MLWRRHHPQEKAARKAEEGQGPDAGVWQRLDPSRSHHRRAADGGGVVLGTTVPTINDAVAEALIDTRHGWNDVGVVRSEHTGTLTGNNKRPDILILEAGVSPVVIENEVLPALSVEKEAPSRLGETLNQNGQRVLSSVAIRTPTRLRTLSGARKSVESGKSGSVRVELGC